VIIAAADGSSLANPGPSGWAWYIDDAHWAAGGWPKGTNNMGELMSVLDLLRATRGTDQSLRILCDSQYAINCCTRWIPAWKKRGWRKADNQPVMNLDLVQQLDVELAGRDVQFQWVRGHSGHPLNERADQLARAAATAYQTGRPVESGPGFAPASLLAPTPAGPTETEPASPTAATTDSGTTDSGTADQPAAEPTDQPPGPAIPSVEPTPPSDRLIGQLEPESPPPVQPLRPDQPDLLSVPDLAPPTPDLPAGLAVQLTELTRQLISAESAADRWRLTELMHSDYVVHLPGGTIRTRGAILARPAPDGDQVQLDVIAADLLAEDLVLLRYQLRRDVAEYLCAAIWVKTAGDWQIRFQQLTRVAL